MHSAKKRATRSPMLEKASPHQGTPATEDRRQRPLPTPLQSARPTILKPSSCSTRLGSLPRWRDSGSNTRWEPPREPGRAFPPKRRARPRAPGRAFSSPSKGARHHPSSCWREGARRPWAWASWPRSPARMRRRPYAHRCWRRPASETSCPAPWKRATASTGAPLPASGAVRQGAPASCGA